MSREGFCENITLTSLLLCPPAEVEGAVRSGLRRRGQRALGGQRTKLRHCGAAQGENPGQLQE